ISKVGVNKYRMEEEKREVALHNYKPEQATESIRRTAELVANRDTAAVTQALETVRQAAAEGQNVMPAMMTAVRAYTTLGEITQTLKDIFGEFQEPVKL
ncbi:MAG: methylmalonyl-CoA mutase, partial [Chloroflexi bacterium]|nr:methylmalonyl-CoA mutase [Chloroflexota bacterium]